MKKVYSILILTILFSSWLFLSPEILAQTTTGGVEQVNTFLENLIKIVAGFAGLIATGFFVLGGLSYITSSGNTATLEKAKRTLLYAGIGLAITIGAFALSGIINDLATKAFGG